MVAQEGRAKPGRALHAALRSLGLEGKSVGSLQGSEAGVAWSGAPRRKLAWRGVGDGLLRIKLKHGGQRAEVLLPL